MSPMYTDLTSEDTIAAEDESNKIFLESEDLDIMPEHARARATGSSRAGALRYAVMVVAAFALAGFVAMVRLHHGRVGAPVGQPAAEPTLKRNPEHDFIMAYQDTEGGTSYAHSSSQSASADPVQTTPAPWRNSTQDWPSLFCWLVAQTVGGKKVNSVQGWWETKLVWEMYMLKVGVFACNEFAIFTDIKSIVSKMGYYGWPYVSNSYTPKEGEIVSWALGSTQAGRNKDTSPSNTMIFVNAWKSLSKSGVLEKHHWVVKQDPDALFLPWRLRWHVQTWPSKDGKIPMFIRNCQTFTSMQGPLEIFSIAMVRLFMPQIDNCGMDSAGEDGKMEKCAQQFGQAFMDARALDDKYCNHRKPNCLVGDVLAFHPLKEIKAFRKCLNQTLRMEQQYQRRLAPLQEHQPKGGHPQ